MLQNSLKQIVHEQSESNWKRIDAFEQRYNKIYNETYQSNETDSDLKEQEESNYSLLSPECTHRNDYKETNTLQL